MTADGVSRTLTIFGSNFQSGNVVQFRWGVGSGAGVWNTGSGNPPSIANASQMSISMNPGTVTDTIYVRVCRSASQTGTANCSSGTQFVSVTAVAPAPTVSSVSPTTMTADGVSRTLTIFGSNFQSGNVVQFRWGVGSGAGVWNTGSGNPPSIANASQMSISMNPGTVTDTIYVRVCRSASQTSTADCSSGTQSVSVTATAPAPTVSSVSPTTMTADGVSRTLTIFGGNFQSGNVVQFRWGVGSGAGVWNTGSGNPPSIANASQMSISMNPGTVTDTIYVRVCRSASQTSTADCSSGTQSVSVTAAAPAPTVSSVSPTTMTADGVSRTLTIFGGNFQSGNVVQFRWGVGSGAGVWNTGSGNPPSIANASQMSISMNPGTVTDTIYVRVCRSASQTSTADCSSGTQSVSVTAAAPAPTVSSVSPTTMTADGVSRTLTIFGGNFQSGNVVQFRWGVGSGAGVWNTGSGNPPSIANASQMSISMNPGTVTDTIYVRVCRSASQTSTADCSSGTQSVSVTAAAPAPTVSSVSPTTMTADGVSRTLTIFGSNFQSGNVVQFRWGVGSGAGVWNTGSGNPPSIANASQMSISMNPGTVTDTIYVRVCRSASQTSTADCSSGTQSVSVTAAAPAPTVSSVSPTTMTADGVSRTLTIFGGNFQSGNVVQFRWGVGSGAGVWNTGSSNPPSIANASQMSISMNPGTVTDTIYVRVCRSTSQTSDADCSSGTQSVSVTATGSAPTVSSVSPTTMTADGVSRTLTIFGGNFQSGNVVQFRWGVGSGAGVWNTGSGNPPSIANASQMSISMNPGTVTDTIYVRVCRSASQTSTADCSSGTQFVSVTAAAPAPTVSSVSPTTMTADGVSRTLTIFGSNFQSGNVVQFRWGVGSGAGVWNTGSSNPPSIANASQMSISMNPGTVTDTIYVRVCRSPSQTGTANCSSGTQSVSVTAVATGNPNIQTSPASGPQGTTFRITGSRFTPNGAVRRYVQGPGSSVQEIGAISADASGQFTWSWVSTCAEVPGSWLAWTIDVTKNQQSNQATQTVASAASCASPVSIQSSPPSGPQGTTFTITGSGFTPNGTVRRLMTAPGQGQQEISSIRADGSGNITWPYTSTCQDKPGTWTLSAIDAGKNRPSNPVAQIITAQASCSAQTALSDYADIVDENYRDGTTVPAATAFTKRWTLRNTGTTTWNSMYRLEFITGDAGCPRTPIVVSQSVAPNQTFAFSTACTAPRVSGEARQVWHLTGPNGTVPVGRSQTIWALITVPPQPTQLLVTPLALSFQYQSGVTGSVPPKPLSILSTSLDVPITAEARTTSGGAWLRVQGTGSTTPVSLTVSVIQIAGAGTYHGSIQITSSAPMTPTIPTITIPVTLTVTVSTPPPQVSPPEKYRLVGVINPNKDTVVLTHGLDRNSKSKFLTGDFWTGDGSKEAQSLIWGAIGPRIVNVLQYVWKDALQVNLTTLGIPTGADYIQAQQHARDAGIELGNRLIAALGPNGDYSHRIHFIGHSLGTIVNTYAASKFLNAQPRVPAAQFTALDRPHHVDRLPWDDVPCDSAQSGSTPQTCLGSFKERYGYDSNFFASILPVNRAGFRIDNYYSTNFPTGVGDEANGPVYNQQLDNPGSLVGVFEEPFPNDHSGVQQWYRWTILPRDPLPDGPSACNGASLKTDLSTKYNASLNPCERGWHWSVLANPDQDVADWLRRFPTNPGHTPVRLTISGVFPAATPLPIAPLSRPCNPEILNNIITRITCIEASSPYSAIPVTIPQGSSTLSFTYKFSSRGDGDYAAVVLDNTPIWILSGSSVTPGVEHNSGPIAVGTLTGNRVLTVALYGTGENNFSFELKNFAVQTAPTTGPALGVAVTHTGNFAQGQQNASHTVIVSNAAGAATTSGTVTVTVTMPSGLALISTAGTGWACSLNTCSRSDALAGGSSFPPITMTVNVAANATSPQMNVVSVTGGGSMSNTTTDSVIVTASGGGGGGNGTPLTGNFRFVPVAPCRVVDTRGETGQTGTFGPPVMAGGATRTFPISASPCGIPSSARAYSLNVTVVPLGPLAYLTTWPTGQQRPLVSTLNSFEGRVVANAAIVPAGTNSSIDVFVTDATHVIIDVNGYFDGQNLSALSFYTATPCRIADTRNAAGTFGGPSLNAQAKRDFPIPSSGCSMPLAGAYSLNATVVPPAALGYLTLWPAGQTQPYVSTLNSFDGAVVANAAIVPAGPNGSISAFVSNASHVILDGNGYFASSGGAGALSFYPVQPCRVADTRGDSGKTGAFGTPTLTSGQTRDFPIPASTCGVPASARAYSINVTVVPRGPLSYLTLWPTGQSQPLVSTLNSFQGRVVANAAIVPAGTNGSVSVFVTNTTDVILDINGYFAP